MKTKLWLFIALFPILLMACTGGSYVIKTGGLHSTSDSISGEYSKFSGYYFKEIDFSRGENIKFSYLASTKNGTLTAKLLNSSGDVMEEITKDTTITIPKQDTYKIQVDGQNHKGSFIITWGKVGQE